jgi:hypothetical protein
MDEASSPYDKALHWLKAGVAAAEIESRLQASGLAAGEIRLLVAAATNALREEERHHAVHAAAHAPEVAAPPPPPAFRSRGEPLSRPPPSTAFTVLKVIGGLTAFFVLLCAGFVFFVAVVCGVH